MKWFGCCAALAAVAWLGVPAQADVLNTRINEIRIDEPGTTDPNEYFELVGDSGQSLNDVWYLVIGDYTAGSGVLEAIIDLTGYTISADGFLLVTEGSFTLATPDVVLPGENPLNFENSDNVTHLLVIGFDSDNWALNDDLDPDDDCVLEFEPWTTELDRVAVIEEENPPVGTECHYAEILDQIIGPQGSYAPGHVYRVPDGTGQWNMGQYDPEGGNDTPGSSNTDLTVTAGATMTAKATSNVEVSLDVQGSYSPQRWLLSLPGAGQGTLKDSDHNPITTFPHQVQGTLYYNPPSGSWTGTVKFEFEGRDAYATKGPANHVVCVQDSKVVISEIMHFPGNEETVFEYIEVYNYSGATVNLWGLGGDVLNTDATANLLGKSIPTTTGNKFRIIAPGGTDPEDEAFRCEWKLNESYVIRVDDDTWQTLRADTALVALYGSDGGNPTLLDGVWVNHNDPIMWPSFTIPDDIGHAIAVTYDWIEGFPFNSSTNDELPGIGVAPWDLLGVTTGYINEHTQTSESGLSWGSPGWIPIHNPTYVPPTTGCEYGECCLPDGSCIETFEADCEVSECGVWSYDDGLCATSPPTCSVPTGACCTPAGDCVTATECECDQINPIGYQGNGTSCGSVTCPAPTGVSFNELDYDNFDLDTAEFIELLGPAGTNLAGWKIELYNGSGGWLYDTINLSGTIPANKLYVVGSEDVPNVDLIFDGGQSDRLQNGPPDGMALVDATRGVVVDSLAYEGSFTANGGAADGQILLDIGADDDGREGSIQKIPNGGFWTETPNLTPGENNYAVTGACCDGETCILSTRSECLDLAAFYMGDGSTCGPDTCTDTCLTIGEARAMGADVGVHLCDVVVGSTFDLVSSASVKSFQIQDATGGLTIFGNNAVIDALLTTPTVVAGDQIDLLGTTDEYNQLMELINGTDGVNGVLLELVGGPTPVGVTATPVSLADFQRGSPTAESLESKLVQLQCVIFDVADGVRTFATGTNYYVRADNCGESTIVRVSTNALNVVGQVIPTGWVNIKGIFSQYHWSDPIDGYQLLIREMADLSTCTTPPTGACCDGGTGCTTSNYYTCEVVGSGYFQCVGSTCTPNPCLPQGTCCLPSSACVITDEATCLAYGGIGWNGDEPIDCDEVTCSMAEVIKINEIRLAQADEENSEYFELYGPGGSPLWGLTYLVIGDGAGGSGVIECIVEPERGYVVPGNGYFVAAESTFETGILGEVVDLELPGNGLNFENSDNTTHLLVTNFSGYMEQDLDTNNDGVLDLTPWKEVLDRVAVIEEANPPTGTEYHYGTIPAEIVGPEGSQAPGQVYRDVDGAGTWTIGTFDPIGVTDTPGCSNMGAGPCHATAVRSYRTHGVAGRLGLNMGVSGGVEPRLGGILELEIDIDDTCGLDEVLVECSAAWSGTASFSEEGGTVTVTFAPALPNQAYCVVTLGCGAEVCVRGLSGDIDRGGLVTPGDASIIKPKFGQTPTEVTAPFDYDVSGLVTPGDFSQVKPRFGNSAPACP